MLLAVAACNRDDAVSVAPAPAKAPEKPAGPPLFADISAACGVSFTYRNGEETANHFSILESLGGGAALIDFNGDGLLDIFLPGGGVFDGADKQDIRGAGCKFFQNVGANKFQDVTAAAGLEQLAGPRPWFYTHGAAVADYDRDGWPDLFVTGWRAVALFRNVAVDPGDPKKSRRFEDVTAQAGLDKGIDWATSAAFGDLDGDGYPDLYVCQYVDWSFKKNPACTYDGKTADVCPPRQFDGLQHKVYRNTAAGRFEDATKSAGLVDGGPNVGKGLGVLLVDVDGDRKLDVYVANDTVDNFLYLNQSTPGMLALDERGLVSLAARDDRGAANGSMGLDVGDPERLGKPNLWVTNYENELHAFYRNNSEPGRPLFTHRTAPLGIAAIGQRFVGWGTAFIDADRDGWEDLFVANGHAIRHPTGKDSKRKQQPVLLRNVKGKFVNESRRIGAYFDTPRLARGVALGDLDNDGHTDLVISHVNEPAAVLRGIGGPDQHWLGVHLAGKDHACTVGAKVTVQAGADRQTKFTKGGGSYLSAHDPRLLFGLGAHASARVTITWPDGSVQTLPDVAVDRYHAIAYHAIAQGRQAP